MDLRFLTEGVARLDGFASVASRSLCQDFGRREIRLPHVTLLARPATNRVRSREPYDQIDLPLFSTNGFSPLRAKVFSMSAVLLFGMGILALLSLDLFTAPRPQG